MATDALVTVKFAVVGRAVGKNQAYIRAGFNRNRGAGGGTGLILSAAGREFKERCARIGKAAMVVSNWPKDIFLVERARVTVRMFGSRHDSGAADVLVRDSLERVFYMNDRCVEGGPQLPPIHKDGLPRVEVDVELLAVHTARQAQGFRDRQAKRDARKYARRRIVVPF